MSAPADDEIEVIHLRRGAVEVRHTPTGTVARCDRHPVSTMNQDEALRELYLDLATRPDN